MLLFSNKYDWNVRKHLKCVFNINDRNISPAKSEIVHERMFCVSHTQAVLCANSLMGYHPAISIKMHFNELQSQWWNFGTKERFKYDQ